MREPTRTGGSVFQSTDSMFAYHSGAWDGSAAYPATWSRGRSITISVMTSMAIVGFDLQVPAGRQHAFQAEEHGAPAAAVRVGRRSRQLGMDEPEQRRLLAVRLQREGHEAGPGPGVPGRPREREPAWLVDLDELP